MNIVRDALMTVFDTEVVIVVIVVARLTRELFVELLNDNSKSLPTRRTAAIDTRRRAKRVAIQFCLLLLA